VRFKIASQVFHHVGRKVPRQFAKKIEKVFLPRDEFPSGHRHFAEHVIYCDARKLGAACGKVFADCAGEKRLRSRALRPAETHGVERALQKRVKGRGEVRLKAATPARSRRVPPGTGQRSRSIRESRV
jgi:hypothetical protein